jgi:hypothetical protein
VGEDWISCVAGDVESVQCSAFVFHWKFSLGWERHPELRQNDAQGVNGSPLWNQLLLALPRVLTA